LKSCIFAIKSNPTLSGRTKYKVQFKIFKIAEPTESLSPDGKNRTFHLPHRWNNILFVIEIGGLVLETFDQFCEDIIRRKIEFFH
jgi:hypothetical protein